MRVRVRESLIVTQERQHRDDASDDGRDDEAAISGHRAGSSAGISAGISSSLARSFAVPNFGFARELQLEAAVAARAEACSVHGNARADNCEENRRSR